MILWLVLDNLLLNQELLKPGEKKEVVIFRLAKKLTCPNP
jgi:hypothetical protein